MSPDSPLLRRWLYAAKPGSWPKLLVPAALGQALGVAAGGRSFVAFALGLAFTVCDLLFIVFLNDWADREVDRLKRRMFPEGCSAKTIPDGILPPHALLVAGLLAGVAGVAVASAAAVLLDRPAVVPLALACLGIFAAYSLPPWRLNYRGGGELLEGLGVGLALPLLHVTLQGGELDGTAAFVLPGWMALSLASGVASGLSDEESDRAAGKTTVASRFGNRAARRVTEGAVAVGIAAWLVGAGWRPWVLLPATAAVLWHARSLLDASPAAKTNAFDAQKRYKQHLHRAIWDGAIVCSAAAVGWTLWP